MIKLTAILSVVAATAFARNNVLEKKLAARPRNLWKKGDPKPTPPNPETCYTKEAFFYTDESNCWQDWDEYCLPNWDSDEECLAITLDFVDSLSGSSEGSDEGGCSVPTPPAEACFYEEAYMYRDGTACVESWRTWDTYCRSDCKDQERCAEIEAAYAAAVAFTPTEPDVTIPSPECFYATAWNYSDQSTCADTWREFDTWCNGSSGVKETCDTVNDDYHRCNSGQGCESTLGGGGSSSSGISPPDPEKCYTYDAYNYLSGDDCA